MIATIVIFAIVLLIISLFILYNNLQTTELSNQLNNIDNIQSTVGELGDTSSDYLLNQTDSQHSIWQSNIASISGNLTELSGKAPPQQNQSIDIIKADIQEVNNSFNNVVSFLHTAPRNENVITLPGFQLAWGTLTDEIVSLASDSAQLSKSLQNQTHESDQSEIALIAVLLTAFAIYLITDYIINYRNTLKSIAQLQDGINIVGSGNLDYSLNTDKKNEIGELSNSFDRMTTNLKNLTIKLQDQERLAAIGQMARMVGHDIRNPLQAISGDLYLIDNDVSSLPEDETKKSLQESVRSIQDNLVYIAKIVEDLQDYAKPQKPNLEKIEIEKVIAEVMALVPVSSNHHVVINIEKDFSGIVADFSMLKRAISNLVNNAVQAMPNGGRLTIRAYQKDAQAFITIEDTGSGIPEEVKSKIFEPMFTTKSKGQGLGLAVVKRLVEAQGGTINFESEEGKGTKFIIKLPST